MNRNTLPSGNTLMFTGILTLVLGLLCIISPAGAGSAVIMVVALVLVVAGVLQVIQAVRSASQSDTLISAVLGVVVVALGVLVWMNPEVGSGFLTMLLMIFFAIHGIWKITTAFRFRGLPGWFFLLLTGLLSLLFVYLLWSQWPLSGATAIGILVGLDLLTTGVVWIMLATAVKKARRNVQADTIKL